MGPFWEVVENPVRLVENYPPKQFFGDGWVKWGKGKLFGNHVLYCGNKILLREVGFGAKIRNLDFFCGTEFKFEIKFENNFNKES